MCVDIHAERKLLSCNHINKGDIDDWAYVKNRGSLPFVPTVQHAKLFSKDCLQRCASVEISFECTKALKATYRDTAHLSVQPTYL